MAVSTKWDLGAAPGKGHSAAETKRSCGLGTSAHVMCELAAWPSPASSYTSSLLATESTIPWYLVQLANYSSVLCVQTAVWDGIDWCIVHLHAWHIFDCNFHVLGFNFVYTTCTELTLIVLPPPFPANVSLDFFFGYRVVILTALRVCEDQFTLAQMGLSRRHDHRNLANRCSGGTLGPDFGLNCLFWPYFGPSPYLRGRGPRGHDVGKPAVQAR